MNIIATVEIQVLVTRGMEHVTLQAANKDGEACRVMKVCVQILINILGPTLSDQAVICFLELYTCWLLCQYLRSLPTPKQFFHSIDYLYFL